MAHTCPLRVVWGPGVSEISPFCRASPLGGVLRLLHQGHLVEASGHREVGDECDQVPLP
jgi:hypothetical protein